MRVKEKQLEFLIKSVSSLVLLKKLESALAKRVVQKTHATKQFNLDFNSEEKAILLNELTLLMTKIGLNDDGRATQSGNMIEEIIDLATCDE